MSGKVKRKENIRQMPNKPGSCCSYHAIYQIFVVHLGIWHHCISLPIVVTWYVHLTCFVQQYVPLLVGNFKIQYMICIAISPLLWGWAMSQTVAFLTHRILIEYNWMGTCHRQVMSFSCFQTQIFFYGYHSITEPIINWYNPLGTNLCH